MGRKGHTYDKNEAVETLRNQKVECLMSGPGIWNANLIWNYFERKDARNILATHLPAESCADEIVWDITTSGSYSFKSGYWMIMENLTGVRMKENLWVQWCKRGLVPKWKMFI